MRILLTNDDGYDAPGLAALYQAVTCVPDVEVSVIAPAVGQSGKGHSVSREFLYRRTRMDPMSEIIIVDGTPPDCVRAAINMPGRRRPDWVIVGINHGSNLGVDIYYSATVAAAREAAMLGVSAMAVSQLVKTGFEDDWPISTRWAAAVITAICRPDLPPPANADPRVHRDTLRALQNQPLSVIPLSADQPVAPVRPITAPSRPRRPAPVCWNINLPLPPASEASNLKSQSRNLEPKSPDLESPISDLKSPISNPQSPISDLKSPISNPPSAIRNLQSAIAPAGVQIVPISIDPLAFDYTHTPADEQSARMTYVGRYHERPATPGTDLAATFAGYITLSLLTLG